MKNNEGPMVIVGGGMTGMLAALFIKKREPQAEVVIVERSERAGGNYRGFNLPGFGYCDRAMRLIYETGIPDFDDILHGLLPEKEWHVMPDNLKDIVGAYWRGELQTHSPYLDLRRLGEPERRQCEREVLERLQKQGGEPRQTENAAQYLAGRFGPTAGGHIGKVLEKFYGVPASALHESATYQPTMRRVVLYGEAEMKEVMRDGRMRSVIAWPDQLTLPVKRQPSQSGLYPRKFGIDRVIDAAHQQLREQGVRFLFNRRVASLKIVGKEITQVILDDGSVIEEPALLVSANGLCGSLSMLRQGTAPPASDFVPPRCWQVYLRVTEKPNMDGLYYCWCFDEDYRTFRVTNYASYCPDAKNEAGYPVCVELWSSDATAEEAIERAVRELRGMKLVNGEEGIGARAAIQAMNMHGFCTLEHTKKLRAMRQEIRERSPRNMLTVGPFIEDGVMLFYEVSRRMCAMISERLGK
jgi:protoporphyrinogen oxidase